MAFEFPASPTQGQVSNGFQWDGEKWKGGQPSGPQKEQFFDLSGKASQDITVPTWAKMARLTVNAFLNATANVGLRLSSDGTTYPAGANDYTTAGFYHASGAAAPGIAVQPEGNGTQFTMTVSSDNTAIASRAQAIIGLTRPTTSAYFTYHGHGSGLHNAVALRYTNNLIQGYAATAPHGSALTLKGLRILVTAGSFGPGSTLQVEWLGDDAQVPISNALSDAPANNAIYGRQNNAWVGVPMSGRNRVGNGNFEVNQRGVASVTASGLFICDRWKSQFSIAGGAATLGWYEDHNLPRNGVHAIYVTTATAKVTLATNEYIALAHAIEGTNIVDFGWGYSWAQPVTLSFRASAIPNGVMSISIRNAAANRSYIATVNLTGAHQTFTITIPGDPTGTWAFDNTAALTVWFMYCGAAPFITVNKDAWLSGNFLTHTAQTNWLAATTQAIYIADVQLEPGPVATPFEKLSYGENLRECQRYYQLFNGVVVENGTLSQSLLLPVAMRAVPTVANTAGGNAGFAMAAGNDKTVHVYQTTRGYGNLTLTAEI